MNMIESLNAATEILSTYSAGSLPEPTYVTASVRDDLPASLGFLMATSGDVERWSFATDTKMSIYHLGSKEIHYTLTFEHDDGNGVMYVNVFHVQRVETPVD